MSSQTVVVNGVDLNINDILNVLRKDGYVRYFPVRDRKTGEICVMAEPKINPAVYEVVEYTELVGKDAKII